MYLDDAIGADDCSIYHVATLASFFARLPRTNPESELHVSTSWVTSSLQTLFVPTTTASPLRHTCLCPQSLNNYPAYLVVFAFTISSCPISYCQTHPITDLLKEGAEFDFTSAVEDTVRVLHVELAAPPIVVLLDWDRVIDKS